MNNYLCFDVGGTSVKYGVIKETGEKLHSGQFVTPSENCRETVPSAMVEVYEQLKRQYSPVAMGISSAGQIEPDGSGVRYAVDNLKDYYPAKFRQIIETRTGLPTIVENDVNAAALGEYWLGAAKGRESFLCVTIGTGIGGAVFMNGSLIKGAYGGAGELGHMTIKFDGRPCSCGQQGCLEVYASHRALLRDFKEASGKDVDGKEFFKIIKAGDPTAEKVFSQFTDYLAVGFAGLVHTLDPGLIIIGGAISKEGAFLSGAIESALDRYAMPSYMEHTQVIPAALANDAGILGACYVAIQYYSQRKR